MNNRYRLRTRIIERFYPKPRYIIYFYDPEDTIKYRQRELEKYLIIKRMILKGYYEKEYLPNVWEGNSWLEYDLYPYCFNDGGDWVPLQIKYN